MRRSVGTVPVLRCCVLTPLLALRWTPRYTRNAEAVSPRRSGRNRSQIHLSKMIAVDNQDFFNYAWESSAAWFQCRYNYTTTFQSFTPVVSVNSGGARDDSHFPRFRCDSCCPSPVLNILLEILWKIAYIAIRECIISVILRIFKMSYQLRNIEQCYLPDSMHSHEKSDHQGLPAQLSLLLLRSWEAAGIEWPVYTYIWMPEYEKKFLHPANLFRSSEKQTVLVLGHLCYCKLYSAPPLFSSSHSLPLNILST